MAWFRRNNDEGNNSDENENKKDKKPKSRKPANTAFRQQRLLAYAPILTPKTVLPLFFALGIIFGPIGGLLLYASSKVYISSNSETLLKQIRSKRSRSTTPIVHSWPTKQISRISPLTSYPQPSQAPIPQEPHNHNGNSSVKTRAHSTLNKTSVKFDSLSRPILHRQSCYTIV